MLATRRPCTSPFHSVNLAITLNRLIRYLQSLSQSQSQSRRRSCSPESSLLLRLNLSLGSSEIIPGQGKVRLQPECLGKMGDTLFRLAGCQKHESKIIMCFSAVWVKSQGFIEL